MADADAEVILDFGGVNLKTLYDTKNGATDVYEYLQQVITNYNTLEPQISDATRDELITIRDQLMLLSLPAGAEYIVLNKNMKPAPNMRPDQHIRREFMKTWLDKPKPAGASKFSVLAKESPHYWSKQDVKRPYWNPYDLLGLFLSKMGPAPGHGAADMHNFYLPLTAVYARFCQWIGGNMEPATVPPEDPTKRKKGPKGKGVGDPSYFYQCTWDPTTGDFFLGATLAGYAYGGGNETGTWEETLKLKRYDLLNNFHQFPGTWEYPAAPTHEIQQKTTRFGNCGETYPYLEMLGPHVNDVEDRRRIHGLALQRDFSSVVEYSTPDFFRFLGPPCINCQALLSFAGIIWINNYVEDVDLDPNSF